MMTTRLAGVLALGALLLAPAASAQTYQTYTQQTVQPRQDPSHVEGSRQGGYLGVNPGAQVPPPAAVPPQLGFAPAPSGSSDMMASPTAWCEKSTDPSRCRGRAAAEHQICSDGQRTPESYANCRTAMHQMFAH